MQKKEFKLKVKHIVLFVIFILLFVLYLLVQPYLFWYLAVKQKFVPGYVNRYYICSVKTSIFKFQKEFTYDWLISDSLNITKNYDVALKYIKEYERLGLQYKNLNIIREFEVYMAREEYDKALVVARKNENFRPRFEMRAYSALGDYKNAMKAYEEYCSKATKESPNMLKYYLAELEMSAKHYAKAYDAISAYFDGNDDSTYIKAWELRAEIEKALGKESDYKSSMKRLKELREATDKWINEELNKILLK